MAFDDKLRVKYFCLFFLWFILLLTSTFRTGPEVGIAWMAQVCNTASVKSGQNGEYTSGTGVSSISKFCT